MEENWLSAEYFLRDFEKQWNTIKEMSFGPQLVKLSIFRKFTITCRISVFFIAIDYSQFELVVVAINWFFIWCDKCWLIKNSITDIKLRNWNMLELKPLLSQKFCGIISQKLLNQIIHFSMLFIYLIESQ